MGAPHGNRNAAGPHKSGVSKGAKNYLKTKAATIKRQQNKIRIKIRKISSMNRTFGSKEHIAMMRSRGYYKSK